MTAIQKAIQKELKETERKQNKPKKKKPKRKLTLFLKTPRPMIIDHHEKMNPILTQRDETTIMAPIESIKEYIEQNNSKISKEECYPISENTKDDKYENHNKNNKEKDSSS